MSRCFKDYDVKQIRQCGCVPATRELVERMNDLLYCDAHSAPLLVKR